MLTRESAHAEEIAVPLDLLLTSSATGVARRMLPDTSWSRFALHLARRPGKVAQRVGSLGRELVSIGRGTSERASAKGDQRFRDPAWLDNPLLKPSMQAYLAANETVDDLFADAHLDWRDAEHLRFVLDVVMEGISPSDNPLISPLGWKAIIDQSQTANARAAMAVEKICGQGLCSRAERFILTSCRSHVGDLLGGDRRPRACVCY